MDRLGSFALGAALVLLSALHMLHAPNALIVLPALLFAGGVVRLWYMRNRQAETTDTDFALAPTAEA